VSTSFVPGARGNHLLLILVGWEKSLRWKRMSRLQDGVAVTLAALAGDEIVAWLALAAALPTLVRSSTSTVRVLSRVDLRRWSRNTEASFFDDQGGAGRGRCTTELPTGIRTR
jgi:hypothetical protein